MNIKDMSMMQLENRIRQIKNEIFSLENHKIDKYTPDDYRQIHNGFDWETRNFGGLPRSDIREEKEKISNMISVLRRELSDLEQEVKWRNRQYHEKWEAARRDEEKTKEEQFEQEKKSIAFRLMEERWNNKSWFYKLRHYKARPSKLREQFDGFNVGQIGYLHR